MEREPAGQENDLDGYRRHRGPGDDTKERQQYAGEDIGGARTTVSEDRLSRPSHVLGIRRVSDELERKVGLDARADVEGAAMVQRPASVRGLQPSQIGRDPGFEGCIEFAQKVLQRYIFRRDRGIGFQFEDPMTVLALLLEQCGGCRLDATVEIRLRVGDAKMPGDALGARHYRHLMRRKMVRHISTSVRSPKRLQASL